MNWSNYSKLHWFLLSLVSFHVLQLVVVSPTQDLTNVDIFMQSKQIEEELLNHQTASCLAWCHENKSKLRKSQR